MKSEDIQKMVLSKRRPGIIKSFMQPTRLKGQVSGGESTPLDFCPSGKTSVGGTQWVIKVQRPGIAQPLIIAKEEKQAAKVIAKEMAKAQAAPAPAPAPQAPATGLSGWRRWFSR